MPRLGKLRISISSFCIRYGLGWVLGGYVDTISSWAVPEKTANNVRIKQFCTSRPPTVGLATSILLFMADFWNFCDTFLRPYAKRSFLFFQILSRCWDSRVQIYPTPAHKIFGVAGTRRVSAENTRVGAQKRLISLKQKDWSKRWVPDTSNGALITSADNSWPPPLPFHKALKIP